MMTCGRVELGGTDCAGPRGSRSELLINIS